MVCWLENFIEREKLDRNNVVKESVKDRLEHNGEEDIAPDSYEWGHHKMYTRLQQVIADGSPVTGPFRGDPFFDPWAPGGSFNP